MEIRGKVRKLKNDKLSGIDGINVEIIKNSGKIVIGFIYGSYATKSLWKVQFRRAGRKQ